MLVLAALLLLLLLVSAVLLLGPSVLVLVLLLTVLLLLLMLKLRGCSLCSSPRHLHWRRDTVGCGVGSSCSASAARSAVGAGGSTRPPSWRRGSGACSARRPCWRAGRCAWSCRRPSCAPRETPCACRSSGTPGSWWSGSARSPCPRCVGAAASWWGSSRSDARCRRELQEQTVGNKKSTMSATLQMYGSTDRLQQASKLMAAPVPCRLAAMPCESNSSLRPDWPCLVSLTNWRPAFFRWWNDALPYFT